MDWDNYQNFSFDELKCKETLDCLMKEEFVDLLQHIRNEFQRPMIVTSGYRSVSHSAERGKKHKGEHTMGVAADIHVSGQDALLLIKIALNNGITRIGVNQKGAYLDGFIHLGIGDRFAEHLPLGIWSY